jgi:hypothetical protein
MECSPIRQVKASRRRRICNWCGDWIEAGKPYTSWFCYSERVTGEVHPECREAFEKSDHPHDEPFTMEYRRGCWCGENEEHCECGKEA